MQEVWKPVNEFPTYMVSNLGRVMNKNGIILHQYDNGNGYLIVGLSANNHHYNRRVSRLVALAFIPNEQGYKEINHINEDKYDNRASNLEWCSRVYNVRYGKRTEKVINKRKKAVDMFKGGVFIKHYDMIKDTQKDGFDSIMVCKCCKGVKGSHRGFTFRYAS